MFKKTFGARRKYFKKLFHVKIRFVQKMYLHSNLIENIFIITRDKINISVIIKKILKKVQF